MGAILLNFFANLQTSKVRPRMQMMMNPHLKTMKIKKSFLGNPEGQFFKKAPLVAGIIFYGFFVPPFPNCFERVLW